MNEVMKCVKGVLNAILNSHHTYIGQQIRPTSFQFRLRCDQFHVLQIRPITYYKHFVGRTATALDGDLFKRVVCHNDYISYSVSTPLQEEQKLVKRLHAILGQNSEHLWCKVMLVKHEFFPEESIEPPDQEERIGRISSMNHVKAMAEQHFEAQPKCHKHGNAVLYDVGKIFVPSFG